MKLFFFFFLAEGPGFLVVVVFLTGTVEEEVAAGRLRAGRAVAVGGGVGGGGRWASHLGFAFESGLHHPFHPFFQSRAHQILVLFFLIHGHAWPLPPREVVSDVWWPRAARETAVGSVARLGRRPDWGSAKRRFFLAAKCPARFNKALLVNSPLYHCTISGSSFLGNTIISSMTTHTDPPAGGGGGFFIVFATGGHIDRLPSNPSTTRAPLDS